MLPVLLTTLSLLPLSELRVDQHGDPLPRGVFARLGTERLFHPGGIAVIAFAPDGKTAATGGKHLVWLDPARTARQGVLVRLWEVSSGRLLREWHLFQAPVTALTFSPAGRNLAAAAGDAVHVWDVATGVQRWQGQERLGAGVQNLGFTADGKSLLIVHRAGLFQVRNTVNGTEMQRNRAPRLQVQGTVQYQAQQSPDGRLLAWSISREQTMGEQVRPVSLIHLAEARTNRALRTLPGFDGAVQHLAFQPDGRTLAVLTGQSLWHVDLRTGQRCEPHPHLAGNEKQLAAATGQTIWWDGKSREGLLWDLNRGECFRGPRLPAGVAWAVAPDRQLLATGLGERLQFWRQDNGKNLHNFPAPRTAPRLYLGPRGELWTESDDELQCLWDALSGKLLRSHPLVEDPDGFTERVAECYEKDLVMFRGYRRLEVRQRSTAELVHLIDTRGGRRFRGSCLFTPGGRFAILVGRDWRGSHLQGYEIAFGRRFDRLEPEMKGGLSPAALTLFSDGRFAYQQRDDTIAVADIRTGQVRRALGDSRHQSDSTSVQLLSLSPDEELLAAVRKGPPADPDEKCTVRIWEVATGWERHRLSIPPPPGRRQVSVNCLTLSPDQRLLAVGLTEEPVLRLFDLVSGRERGQLRGHQKAIQHLRFWPRGDKLASSSEDGVVLVWNLRRPLNEPTPTRPPRPLTDLWRNLGSEDPAAVDAAIWELVGSPEQAIPWLRQCVPPLPPVTPKQLKPLLTALNSATYAERVQAEAQVAQLDAPTQFALERELLAGMLPLEVQRRLQRILPKLRQQQPTPHQRQALRAVEVLERIGSPAARQLLRELAQGTAARCVVEAAASSLRRLEGR